MKKQLITGALIVVIGVSTFFAQKEAMKIADIRADEIYSATVAQAAKALPRTTVQRVVNTPEEKKFLAGWVKQEFKDDTYTEKTVSGTLLVMHEHEISKDGIAAPKEGENIHKLYFKTATETYAVENITFPVMENLNGIEVTLTGLLSAKENVKGQKTLIVNIPDYKIKTLKPKVHKPVKDWAATQDRGGSCGGNYCALIVLVDMSGNPAELPLPSEIHDYIFTNPGRIKNALNEMSYGQMIYDGDVTDWIDVSSQSTYWGGTITPEMELYMIENSIDLNNYDQITYLVNNPGGPLHTNGVAWTEPGFEDLYVGESQTYYSIAQNRVGFGAWSYRNDLTASGGNLSQFDALYIHETGHNLGAKHDNSFICKNGAISLPSECIHHEYGNRYSIMGSAGGSFAGHFSTLQKLKIGWLDSSDVPFVSTSNTQITPIESIGAKSVAVDINSDLIPEYVLEKRAYVGIDTPASKSGIYKTDTALVYKIDAPSYATPDWYSWINHYRLIDVTPPVNEWESWQSFQSATLNSIPLTSLTSNIGQLNGTIIDSNRGINITAIKNPLGGVVNVSSNPSGNSCVHRPIKVFSTGWNSTQFDGQLPYRNWSQSQEPIVYSNLEGIEVDTTDPLAQVPIVVNFSVPNNDSPACPPADYEAKLIFNGEVSGLVSTATFEPWTGDNYLYAYTNLLAYGLPYGEHTIVLQVTKLNDGSQVSFDLKFVLEE